MRIRPILHAMNRHSPIGGVERPNAKVSTNTIENCMGSMPMPRAIGNSSGTKITMAGPGSRNAPIKIRNTTTDSMNRIGWPANTTPNWRAHRVAPADASAYDRTRTPPARSRSMPRSCGRDQRLPDERDRSLRNMTRPRNSV